METIYWVAQVPRVTEEAGTRGGTHTGIDLAADRGDPVLAPFDGVAVFVGGDGANGRIPGTNIWANGEGRTIDILRADGLVSRVGHLEGYAIKQGDRVTAGQTVGYAGDSGFSTGVHIHWELRWDRAWSGGNWINPRSVNPAVFAGKTEDEGEEDMRGIIYRSTQHGKFGCYAGPTGGFVILANEEEFKNLTAIGTPVVWLTPKTLQELITDARKMQTR